MEKLVIGLDFGTDSVRAVIVDAGNGEEVSVAVALYPRWKHGLYCNPLKNQYRQHPQDYLDSMIQVVREAVVAAPEGTAGKVAGISFDTTGSTPVFIDKEGTPLALLPEFSENPNAMFILWKDHTAIAEAAEINTLCSEWSIDYSRYVGGIYSSEWVWAKTLHVLREDHAVRKAAYSWVEHCDWMPAILTGNTIPEELIRSRCAAGHKAMWHEDFDGLPSEEFLSALDPLLSSFRKRLYRNTYPANYKVGYLTPEWSAILGLTSQVSIGAGAFDAHMGAVGGGIKPHSLLRVMGTSTCDMLVAPYEDMKEKLVRGICGQVDGSVVPGMIGLEAGQSAFGDVYAWFKKMISWPLQFVSDPSERENIEDLILAKLTEEALKLPDDDTVPIATDWLNGRRTPDADQTVTATISGLTLGTDAPMIFKSLVEATAFGSRAIAERFTDEGVPILEVIAIGGVAKKSPFVMQILADVMNTDIKVASADQACALGAAMFAATAAGIYNKVEDAMAAMEQGFDTIYHPDSKKIAFYDLKYRKYKGLAE
ncbi:MAG: ribulokinase [Bacteroidia bacterium]|nr:ribulokinase [Bacteroidia bacterium]